MRQAGLWGYPVVDNSEVLCLPYMGSKRKIANTILNAIYKTIGDFPLVYDLFGGGGAFSVAALMAGHKVVYNEFNPAIAALLKRVVEGGEIPKEWISRESFFELITGSDWRAGLAMCCWSFGNNQKGYLFSADIESLKRLGHEIVVNKNASAKSELEKLLKISLPEFNSRNDFSAFFKRAGKRLDMQQLEGLERLERLQQLEGLERLERLQQLEGLQQLEITCKDYSAVKIQTGAVIYCDPPYESTAAYQKTIDHAAFWNWCREQEGPVFISEYNAPKDFEVVLELEHRSTLSATSNSTATVERLFWNGKRLK